MTLLILASIGVAAYVLAARWAVPYLVDEALARLAAEAPGRAVRVESVRFAPFAWRLELDGLRFEQAERLTLDADRIVARVSPRSVLERRLVLGTLVVTAPRAGLRLGGPATSLATLDVPLAPWRIERLELTDGALEVVSHAAPGSVVTSLGDISGAADGLDARTASEQPARATVLAHGAAESELALEARIAPGLTRAEGRFSLRGLEVGALARLDERLAKGRPGGRLRLEGDYTLHAADGYPVLEIANGRAELSALEARAAGGVSLSAPRVDLEVSASLVHRERLAVASAAVSFADQRFDLVAAEVAPAATYSFAEVSGTATVGGSNGTRLDAHGRLGGAGPASVSATPHDLALRLDAVPAMLVSPQARAVLGHGLARGRLDLALDYALAGPGGGRLRVAAADLAFGLPDARTERDVAGPDIDTILFAVALLEAPDGRLELAVPLTAGPFAEAVRATLRHRILTLTRAPFDVLGRLVARSGARLSDVLFEPGAAALSEPAAEALGALAEALHERPRLALGVPRVFHPSADRDALAAQQIELHVLLATAGPTFRARPEPIDFASPRAHDVLDEFARERLPAARLDALAAGYTSQDAPPDVRADYYRALFEALVANETIEPQALERLARFRAQSIVDALSRQGVAAERLTVGAVTTLSADADAIELPLSLERASVVAENVAPDP